MAKKKLIKSNTSTSDSLSYFGSIEVKVIRGNTVLKTVKTHNKGRFSLFSFLASCLIGRYEYSGTPKYIMLGYFDSEAGTTTQVSTNAIPYSGVSLVLTPGEEGVSEGSASAIFKFLVPFSTVTANEEINCIRLYNSDINWDNHCAFFILDTSVISDGKSNILITWTMKVANQLEVEGEE